MAVAHKPDEEDFVIEHDGVRLVVDPDSAPLLEGAEIDYVDDLMKAGFTIFNPNAVKSCACGTSFDEAAGGQLLAQGDRLGGYVRCDGGLVGRIGHGMVSLADGRRGWQIGLKP